MEQKSGPLAESGKLLIRPAEKRKRKSGWDVRPEVIGIMPIFDANQCNSREENAHFGKPLEPKLHLQEDRKDCWSTV